jgi:hypothetical protein
VHATELSAQPPLFFGQHTAIGVSNATEQAGDCRNDLYGGIVRVGHVLAHDALERVGAGGLGFRSSAKQRFEA